MIEAVLEQVAGFVVVDLAQQDRVDLARRGCQPDGCGGRSVRTVQVGACQVTH
jgi:hypothetical protein